MAFIAYQGMDDDRLPTAVIYIRAHVLLKWRLAGI